MRIASTRGNTQPMQIAAAEFLCANDSSVNFDSRNPRRLRLSKGKHDAVTRLIIIHATRADCGVAVRARVDPGC